MLRTHMLSNTVQNLVAKATRCPRLVHPWSNATASANFCQVIVVACSVMSAAVIRRSVTLLLKYDRCCNKLEVCVTPPPLPTDTHTKLSGFIFEEVKNYNF
jgi:hypothetical protein